jgi:(S)-ureidoglycine aminohydrolase
MSMHHLGETRSRRALDHLLQTPDTFVWAPLPGMVRATACVHTAPALGAAFVQYSVDLERDGSLGPTRGSRFVYVLEGELELLAGERHATLGVGGYCFVPQGMRHTLTSPSADTRAAVIEKPYLPLDRVAAPALLIASEGSIPGIPLNGDEALQVRALLPPDDPSFDFAVNTMEYQPGASLSMVEVHMMEHGLLMLDGDGIYRLGDAWYPVAKGDFIWMGPYCPQWFGALGKRPAKYLIYKDWNRHPLEGR